MKNSEKTRSLVVSTLGPDWAEDHFYPRLAAVLAACVVLACLGSTYAWSVFVSSLRENLGWSSLQCQGIFAVRTVVFAVFVIIGGKIQARVGVHRLVRASGIAFAAGYLLPSLGPEYYALSVLGLGVLTGMGTGLGYIGALGVSTRAFPRHRGLLVGLGAGAFAIGSILVSEVAIKAFEMKMSCIQIFAFMGILMGGLILVCERWLWIPLSEGLSSVTSSSQSNLRRNQITAFVSKFSGNIGGLFFISNLVPLALALGVSRELAHLGIAFFAVGNTLGRICWGYAYDQYGYRCVPWSLIGMAGVFLALGFFGWQGWGFLLCTLLIGSMFGACFVLYASWLAECHGPSAVNNLYPMVFLAHGIAALVGPVAGGWLLDSGVPPRELLAGAGLIALMGGAVFAFVASPPKQPDDMLMLHVASEVKS